VTVDQLYFRQLRSGQDFARNDHMAYQMANFAYLIGDRNSGEAFVVDPAYAPTEIIELLENDGMRLAAVIATHHHPDHLGGLLFNRQVAGVAELLGQVKVPIHAHHEELEWIERTTGVGPENLVAHDSNDVVRVGDIEIRLLHTPGHTAGGQCLLVEQRLVAGDTLFLQGCGRTDLPGGDPSAMYASLFGPISLLPDDTVVYPGHLYSPEPSAPLGDIKRTNPVLATRTLEQWLALFGG